MKRISGAAPDLQSRRHRRRCFHGLVPVRVFSRFVVFQGFAARKIFLPFPASAFAAATCGVVIGLGGRERHRLEVEPRTCRDVLIVRRCMAWIFPFHGFSRLCSEENFPPLRASAFAAATCDHVARWPGGGLAGGERRLLEAEPRTCRDVLIVSRCTGWIFPFCGFSRLCSQENFPPLSGARIRRCHVRRGREDARRLRSGRTGRRADSKPLPQPNSAFASVVDLIVFGSDAKAPSRSCTRCWGPEFSGHTISRRGFNLFKPLWRHLRANSARRAAPQSLEDLLGRFGDGTHREGSCAALG